MFDNRTLINKVGLAPLQTKWDRLRGQGRNHFALRVNDRLLGYCYIRKNACSSFKRMFLDLSPAQADRRPDERPIDFMRRHHVMHEADFDQCDHLIVVYRDPVERIMSMFRNKFIAVNGAEDIHRNFVALEGREPVNASFRYFVERYLQRDFKRLDRHVQPQSVHLRRAVYTDVIPVKGLYDHMINVVGPELAGQYFKRPVNRTSDVKLVDFPGAADMPIRDIRQEYAVHGHMPDDASLLSLSLRQTLEQRYAVDYAMIADFKGRRSK
ncbi:sulfotransferase family 2 domain-containing protein [Loktanella sp. S4079]|uniref:sulfotransferase family 2 domain-containing protein n=1 Tax=Loktanella sp. S4079 TaxID=579483 RepID=UPI0005F9E0F7|nr:sulfotransferase family 2 domain-containing protein [Loktanella sp. S4079]KJZ18500.1 hypothetical protein TW80_13775 [Loktanella sp. S4079]